MTTTAQALPTATYYRDADGARKYVTAVLAWAGTGRSITTGQVEPFVYVDTLSNVARVPVSALIAD